jgi:hypothetical protein
VVEQSKREYTMEKKGGNGLGLGPNATNFLLTRAWEDVRKVTPSLSPRSPLSSRPAS